MSIHNHLIGFLLIMMSCLTIHPLYSSAGSRSPAYEEKLLVYINQYRTAHGLKTLAMDNTLVRLAEDHSMHMEKTNVLSHERFRDRFQKSGRLLCVENVGWNYHTPMDQFRGWKSSPEHDKNLLNNKITSAGIAQTGQFVTFFACE